MDDPVSDQSGVARRIAMKPSDNPVIRRCVRILAMVHELHKAGYQKVRILPMIAPSGAYWRGIMTYSDNVADNGYSILDEDIAGPNPKVARYSSGSGNEYFGWPDAKTLNARALAQLFIERFPLIAQRGVGRDWAYAGWLTDVLGSAESASNPTDLIHLEQDWEEDPRYLQRWGPPPPVRGL